MRQHGQEFVLAAVGVGELILRGAPLRDVAEGMRITQRTAAELIGRNHWDVWPHLAGTDAPSSAAPSRRH